MAEMNKEAEGQTDANSDHDKESKQPKNTPKSYLTSFPDDKLLYDRAYGCVIGAAIGDSIGSYCEFRKTSIDKGTLSEAMTMPGGGTWGKQVITGQVTDDTELAVCLAYGLINIIGKSSVMTREKQDKNINIEKQSNKKVSLMKAIKRKVKSSGKKQKNEEKDDVADEKQSVPESKAFDAYKIAVEYVKWRRSYPFDMGFCTRATLSKAPDVKAMKQTAIEYDLEKDRQYRKGGNMANGAMMRCMPLCLYGYRLNEDNLYKLMVEDASMTHSNTIVFLTNTCYALMVQYLLKADVNNDNRHKEAYDTMYKWLERKSKISDKIGEAAKQILDEWLADVDGGELDDLQPAPVTMGFVKIAFQRCCYHLLAKSSYKDAIESVVGEGGDTDTNACIVGGIMGVYHGLTNIPDEYIVNIHECNPMYDRERDMFQAKWYFKDKIAELLVDNAPTDMECVL